jgi:hypothetical protein
MTLDRWIRDTAERMIATFVAAVIAWLLAAGSLDATWVEALVAATIPPVLVVLSNALPALVYTGPVWWIDALVRVARSFVQGFLGALLAGQFVLDVSTLQAAAMAGLLAAAAVVKTLLARRVDGTISPASLARLQ